MDNNKLHALLTAIRTGSFSKAARELNCTQSAVTQMMNSLENELGFKILLRSHNGVKLTPLGEELLPYIVEADSSFAKLMTHAKRIADGKARPILIGSFSSISNTWLPQILKVYQKENPDASFDIRIGTDTLSEWLLNGKIDLALGDADRCKAFRWYPLMNDPYLAVLPKSFLKAKKYCITQEELMEFPFIMAPMNALEPHLTAYPKRKINVNTDDDSTLLSMVEQELGVTIMPKLSLQSLSSEVEILELKPPMKRVLGVALPNEPDKAAVKFKNYLCKSFLSETD